MKTVRVSLAVKLAAIVFHLEEYVGHGGHYSDRIAADQLRKDPEVSAFLDNPDNAALFPLKRSKR